MAEDYCVVSSSTSCRPTIEVVDDGNMSMYEKMCYMIQLFKDALAGLDNIDDLLALKEDKENLTNNRLLSETGDFTGTWGGETSAELKEAIQNQIDALQLLIDALEQDVSTLDTKIDDGLALKEDIISITNNRLLDLTGNFTGTWSGETYNDFKDHITNGETLYQTVIDLITANPNVGVEVIDGGFLANPTPPTEEDLGLVVDLPTEEIDAGKVIYPCVCSV